MSRELVDAMVLVILEQPLPGERKIRDSSAVRTAIKNDCHHNDVATINRVIDSSKERVRFVHAERLRVAHTLDAQRLKRTHDLVETGALQKARVANLRPGETDTEPL